MFRNAAHQINSEFARESLLGEEENDKDASDDENIDTVSSESDSNGSLADFIESDSDEGSDKEYSSQSISATDFEDEDETDNESIHETSDEKDSQQSGVNLKE